MEPQRIRNMQIHFRISEPTVIQTHRINMNLRIHPRSTKHTGYIGLTCQQTVEHDCLLRQHKRHDVRGIQLKQVHKQRIGRPARSQTIRVNMLSAAFKSKILHRHRRVRRAISHPTLAQRINGVPEHQRTRHKMHIDERLTVVLREMGNELQISSVGSCSLGSDLRLQPILILILTVHLRLFMHGYTGEQRVAESNRIQLRVHLQCFRGHGQRQTVNRIDTVERDRQIVHRRLVIPHTRSVEEEVYRGFFSWFYPHGRTQLGMVTKGDRSIKQPLYIPQPVAVCFERELHRLPTPFGCLNRCRQVIMHHRLRGRNDILVTELAVQLGSEKIRIQRDRLTAVRIS